MPSGDDHLDRLRSAIDELAASDAEELIARARAEARARVHSRLVELMERSMLEHVQDWLVPASPLAEVRPQARAKPKPGVEPETGIEPEARVERVTADPGTGDAWYVYGVVEVGAEPQEALPGVDASRSVEMLREGSLAAAVSHVALEEFSEERLREHLRDMEWVERVARAHERVLDRLRAGATLIPMRMCTVYRTESGVREMLRREAAALSAAIDHLDGKAEWGVKAFADARNMAAVAGSADEDVDDEARGAAYMRRKRDEKDQRDQARRQLEESAAQIHERLCELAADGLVTPPQRPEVSGHEGDMVLNGVYLVADGETERLHEEVQALQVEYALLGVELELTGPWPAYNFVPGTIGAAW